MSDSPIDPLAVTHFDAPSLETLDHLFPGYRLENFIAKGGMGAVYLATQTSLDRPVAIKVLPQEFGDNDAFRESFESEAKIMARLNHANLIGIYDFGDVDGMLYIIMEYVLGKSLYESAYGKAIVQDKAGEIVRDICLGLDHAHSAGILHRDIKPANILIGKGTQPKIGDFGLARPTDLSETGIIYGTPGYAAPEVTLAPETVNASTDIYSVGIILYELLTGHMPNTEAYEPLKVYSDCDSRFEAIIQKAIHPDSSQRYSAASQMAEDISKILTDLTRQHDLLNASTAASQTSFNNLLQTPGTGKSRAFANFNQSSAPQLVKSTAPVTQKTLIKSTPSVATAAAAPQATATDSQPLDPDEKPRTQHSAPAQVKTHNPAIRNIVIILVLLGALAFAWDFKTKREKKVKKQNAIVKLENDRIANEKALIAQKYRDEQERRKALAPKPYNPNKTNTGSNPKTSTDMWGDSSDPSEDTVVEQPDVETNLEPNAAALEKIAISKTALRGGQREKSLFPDTAFFKNNDSRALMFVETPMTWHEADQWARNHGGHLATCIGDSEVSELGLRLDGVAKEAWLGAGNNGSKGWVWSDGAAWDINATFPTTSKRQFVKVTNLGYLGAVKSTTKLPFYMEWKMNGTNPGTIESRLQRVSRDIESRQLNPSFPPGTMNVKSRTYAIVNKDLNFNSAYRLASISGGHLLVISDKSELLDLENLIESSAPEAHDLLVWVGAEKKDSIWKWITNEPWTPIKWADGHPADHSRLAIKHLNSQITIQDHSADDTAPYFIIEWSNDQERETVNSNSELKAASDAYNFSKLKTKAQEILAAQIEKTEDEHVANIERLGFKLSNYLKSLPQSEQMDQKDDIQKLTATVNAAKRLPKKINNSGPSKRIKDYTSYAYTKQLRIEKDHAESVSKIRAAYLNQLVKLRAAAIKARQSSAAKTIEDAVDDLGRSNLEFQNHLGL